MEKTEKFNSDLPTDSSTIDSRLFSSSAILETWWNIESELDHCAEDLTTKTTAEYLGGDLQQERAFELVAKKTGVFSGRRVLEWIEKEIPGWSFEFVPADGAPIMDGQSIVKGKARLCDILARERMLLNLLQHLSGIASATRLIFDQVQKNWSFDTPAPALLHTRKFLPFLRTLQLDACVHGGGRRHREHLGDRILFKDNHKKLLYAEKRNLSEFMGFLRRSGLLETSLIEVENPAEAKECLAAGARHLMLDNFEREDIKQFCAYVPESNPVSIEVSGSLNLENVASYLVHERISRLSFGALTHSVRAQDISLELSL
jgi:nicotinate-nucleotide pyrophosphorylase (carboxylating)